MTALRLTLRSHRFETVIIGAFTAAALAGAIFVVARLATSGIPTSCFTNSTDALCAGRNGQIQSYLNFAGDWGFYALGGITVMPVLSGLILGIALAGKELDRGTTVFAWSFAPSRRRWLLARVLPIALAIVAAGLAGGWLADQLEALRNPGVDPNGTFEHIGLRGPIVAAEGLAIFGIALATGAILGRILPSLLVAIVLTIGAIAGVTALSEALLHDETVVVYGVDGGPTGPIRWRTVQFRLQDPDGSIIDWEEAYNRYGDVGVVGEGGDTNVVQLRTVLFVNPGEMYPLAAARIALLYGTLGLSTIVLAFAAVDRRRP